MPLFITKEIFNLIIKMQLFEEIKNTSHFLECDKDRRIFGYFSELAVT